MRFFFLIVFMCPITFYAKKIKVATCLAPNKVIEDRFWGETKRLCQVYKDNIGIKFVDVSEADIVITDKFYSGIESKPLILIDKSDAVTIPDYKLSCLESNQIKAYFANYILRPLSLNLKAMVKNSYHFSFINDIFNITSVDRLKTNFSNYLHKVKLVPWTSLRNVIRLDDLKKLEVDFQCNERIYDVSYIGAIYHSRIPSQFLPFYICHRTQVINKLLRLKNINSYIKIVNIVNGKPIEKLHNKKYIEILQNSKIVISPWGAGEWCWRDYEAFYTGAVLIKPESSFVKSVPDVYQNNYTYVPCKYDFSDLKEKIQYVLDNYEDFLSMRKTARQLLLDYTQKDFILHFAQSVLDAYHA